GEGQARRCATRRPCGQFPRGGQRYSLRLRRHLHWWPAGRNQMQSDSRARLAAILVAVIASAGMASTAWHKSNRTIKIILPFAPGGPAYNAIRILGQQISATGGPTIV